MLNSLKLFKPKPMACRHLLKNQAHIMPSCQGTNVLCSAKVPKAGRMPCSAILSSVRGSARNSHSVTLTAKKNSRKMIRKFHKGTNSNLNNTLSSPPSDIRTFFVDENVYNEITQRLPRVKKEALPEKERPSYSYVKIDNSDKNTTTSPTYKFKTANKPREEERMMKKPQAPPPPQVKDERFGFFECPFRHELETKKPDYKSYMTDKIGMMKTNKDSKTLAFGDQIYPTQFNGNAYENANYGRVEYENRRPTRVSSYTQPSPPATPPVEEKRSTHANKTISRKFSTSSGLQARKKINEILEEAKKINPDLKKIKSNKAKPVSVKSCEELIKSFYEMNPACKKNANNKQVPQFSNSNSNSNFATGSCSMAPPILATGSRGTICVVNNRQFCSKCPPPKDDDDCCTPCEKMGPLGQKIDENMKKVLEQWVCYSVAERTVRLDNIRYHPDKIDKYEKCDRDCIKRQKRSFSTTAANQGLTTKVSNIPGKNTNGGNRNYRNLSESCLSKIKPKAEMQNNWRDYIQKFGNGKSNLSTNVNVPHVSSIATFVNVGDKKPKCVKLKSASVNVIPDATRPKLRNVQNMCN